MVGVNVMHTNFSTMGRVLDFVRNDCGWTGACCACSFFLFSVELLRVVYVGGLVRVAVGRVAVLC